MIVIIRIRPHFISFGITHLPLCIKNGGHGVRAATLQSDCYQSTPLSNLGGRASSLSGHGQQLRFKMFRKKRSKEGVTDSIYRLPIYHDHILDFNVAIPGGVAE